MSPRIHQLAGVIHISAVLVERSRVYLPLPPPTAPARFLVRAPGVLAPPPPAEMVAAYLMAMDTTLEAHGMHKHLASAGHTNGILYWAKV